tara:strand:- start:597 stop:1379 length:783 start_codon:yes stop_codon:yes gene_type:complete
MKSIILAAGKGARMGDKTKDCPKSLIKLNNIPIIERQIAILKKAGIYDITLITGFMKNKFNYLGLPQIFNSDYNSTNMVQSLYCAKDYFNGEHNLIISYGDIVYEKVVISKLISYSDEISVVIDKSWQKLWEIRMEDILSDVETLKLDKDNFIIEIGGKPKRINEIEGQYIGLFMIPKKDAPYFFKFYESLISKSLNSEEINEVRNIPMTSYLKLLIKNNIKLNAVFIHNSWLEIDTSNDLDLYQRLHKKNQLSKYCNID